MCECVCVCVRVRVCVCVCNHYHTGLLFATCITVCASVVCVCCASNASEFAKIVNKRPKSLQARAYM